MTDRQMTVVADEALDQVIDSDMLDCFDGITEDELDSLIAAIEANTIFVD